MHALLMTLLLIVALALIVVVLLQSGSSAGLSGAISGGAEQLFGKQKARGHVITLGPEKEQLHEDIYEFLESLDWNV